MSVPVVGVHHNPIMATLNRIENQFRLFQGRVIWLAVQCSNAVNNLLVRIGDLIKAHQNCFFFIASTAYAAISFPALFFSAVPIGTIGAFLIGQTALNLKIATDFYLCKSSLYEGAIAQTLLGTLNVVGKAIVALNNGRFGLAQEGVTSSLLSGVIAGAYLHSMVAFAIDSIREKFFLRAA